MSLVNSLNILRGKITTESMTQLIEIYHLRYCIVYRNLTPSKENSAKIIYCREKSLTRTDISRINALVPMTEELMKFIFTHKTSWINSAALEFFKLYEPDPELLLHVVKNYKPKMVKCILKHMEKTSYFNINYVYDDGMTLLDKALAMDEYNGGKGNILVMLIEKGAKRNKKIPSYSANNEYLYSCIESTQMISRPKKSAVSKIHN